MTSPEKDNIDHPRHEALFDLDYASELNYRHRKLYQLLRFVFGFIFIASGMFAFSTSMPGWLQSLTAGLVTVSGILSVMIDPGSKAEQHHRLRERYLELIREAPSLKTDDILGRTQALYVDSLYVLRSLEHPAWNTCMRRYGHEHKDLERLTCFERFMGAIT